MLGDPVLDRLRAVQKLLRLRATYGDERLEAACTRAEAYGVRTYREVKAILVNELDVAPASMATATPSSLYSRGGRFLRAPANVN